MLLAAYAVFALAAAAALDADRGGSLVRRHAGLIRAANAVLAALLAVGAALRLDQVAGDDQTSWGADRWAFLLPGAIGAGAVMYLVGSAIRRGRPGVITRWAGWLLIVAALLFPSTLTLLLPLAALLALTLRAAPQTNRGPEPQALDPKVSSST